MSPIAEFKVETSLETRYTQRVIRLGSETLEQAAGGEVCQWGTYHHELQPGQNMRVVDGFAKCEAHYRKMPTLEQARREVEATAPAGAVVSLYRLLQSRG